jgi:hypothetical protein
MKKFAAFVLSGTLQHYFYSITSIFALFCVMNMNLVSAGTDAVVAPAVGGSEIEPQQHLMRATAATPNSSSILAGALSRTQPTLMTQAPIYSTCQLTPPVLGTMVQSGPLKPILLPDGSTIMAQGNCKAGKIHIDGGFRLFQPYCYLSTYHSPHYTSQDATQLHYNKHVDSKM